LQHQSGIILANSVATVTFESGVKNVLADIAIQGNGFLEIDTTFSVSLTEVQYLGAGGR
jgi:hypothetical protein